MNERAKGASGKASRSGVRLLDALTRIQERGLPLEDQVVLAQTKECLRELIGAPWMSDMVLEQLRRGTTPLEWPGAPTERTREVLRSLSEAGKREYLRRLLSKAGRSSDRVVLEAAFVEEFGVFFPD